jgi:hypothetical protein
VQLYTDIQLLLDIQSSFRYPIPLGREKIWQYNCHITVIQWLMLWKHTPRNKVSATVLIFVIFIIAEPQFCFLCLKNMLNMSMLKIVLNYVIYLLKLIVIKLLLNLHNLSII